VQYEPLPDTGADCIAVASPDGRTHCFTNGRAHHDPNNIADRASDGRADRLANGIPDPASHVLADGLTDTGTNTAAGRLRVVEL
jgi:hypothetical protein